MANQENRKVLLSVKDLVVKFHVRGRILTAIRGISLDVYENESIAIVGESGSGKSVFTKTFAGMLDQNGFIDQGKIIFDDEDLSKTSCTLNSSAKQMIRHNKKKLDEYSRLEAGASIYRELEAAKDEMRAKMSISAEEEAKFDEEIKALTFDRTEAYNLRKTLDASLERERYKAVGREIEEYDAKIKAVQARKEQVIKSHREAAKNDTATIEKYNQKIAELQSRYDQAIQAEPTEAQKARNDVLAKEIHLSIARYPYYSRVKFQRGLLKDFREAMRQGLDISDDEVRNSIFDKTAFRVRLEEETETSLSGKCINNLANIHYYKDWGLIRGGKIATVFQDPMTSLNPIIPIGKQITSIILKHQKCSEAEARKRAMVMMKKVGIPNAEKRFDDYPFQYSGGMRQRIVIAIALSCQPKILICDEPTTALDVTIQAQILRLLKDLQKEFNFTIVFITHDLGVVANIADRVAVLYAGELIELGTVEDVFYDPRHPYTWALMSSLPQLAQRNTKLYSITGTPPSLYNKIVGDPFAPRNPYCLKIDTIIEPPMFQISETHSAKTWLLDPRAPKMEKPEAIQGIHEKLVNAFNI